MRDAQSALDQVIAFAGTTITVEDVSTVLGIVGRDLLFDIVTGVADENPMAAFTLAGRAVELGYDLRLCAASWRTSRAVSSSSTWIRPAPPIPRLPPRASASA